MRRGKYAGVIDKLPKHLGHDPDYNQKVNFVKTEITTPVEALNDPTIPADDEKLFEEVDELVIDALAKFIRVSYLLKVSSRGRNEASVYARIFSELRALKESLENQVSTTELLIKAYSELMIEKFEADKIDSLRLASGELIYLQSEPRANVVDKGMFQEWCIEHGLLGSLRLPWATTNMLVKDLVSKGEKEPLGVVAEAFTKAVLRRS